MNLESPQWDDWERRFMALAERVTETSERLQLSDSSRFLGLYGDNGLDEAAELAELSASEQSSEDLLKITVETAYWQETVLFVPN